MRRLRPLLGSLLLVVVSSAAAIPSAARAAPAPEPDDGEQTEPSPETEEAFADPPSPAEQKASRRIVAGAVAGGFGLILTLVAFGLLGARATCEVEGEPTCAKKMGIGALSTGIPGLALLATGGTLLGLGFKQRRKLVRAEHATALPSPLLLHGGAGGGFTVRF